MPRKYVDILRHLEILRTLNHTEIDIEFVRKEAMRAMYSKEDGEEEEKQKFIEIGRTAEHLEGDDIKLSVSQENLDVLREGNHPEDHFVDGRDLNRVERRIDKLIGRFEELRLDFDEHIHVEHKKLEK